MPPPLLEAAELDTLPAAPDWTVLNKADLHRPVEREELQSMMPEAHRLLTFAQDQHRCVVEAISDREGARAQAIMQEHARVAARTLRLALRSEKAFGRVPGGTLIRTVR